jgi:hypothetical protein
VLQYTHSIITLQSQTFLREIGHAFSRSGHFICVAQAQFHPLYQTVSITRSGGERFVKALIIGLIKRHLNLVVS